MIQVIDRVIMLGLSVMKKREDGMKL